MNEQYKGQEPNMSLPQPVEAATTAQEYEKQQTKAVEQGQATGSGVNAPPVGVQTTQITDTSSTQPVASSSSLPQIADDVDLIEKEWVERAKRIVEQTKNDPYRQSEELHATKDDYQMKRFNRDIKLNDTA